MAGAAAIVFTRVFAFSVTTLGFTEYARGLVGSGTAQADANLLAGIALGAYGLTMALAQLGTGILSDRIGRRPVLWLGAAIFVAGGILCAVADSIGLLIAGRLVAGLGGVSSAALAAVGETVPEERRTTAMALVGVPAGLAVFLGFIVGPPLAAAFGFPALFWGTALLGVLSSVHLLLRPLPPPMPGLARPRRSLGLPVLALAMAGFTVNFAMTTVMYDFATSVLQRIGSATLAVALVVAFLVMAAASRAVDRGGKAWRAIVFALVVLACAAPLFRLNPAFAVTAVAGTLFFAAHAALSALLPSQVSRLAGRSGGLGHGIQLVVAYLGSAAGGLVAGATAHRLPLAFVAVAAVAGVSGLLVVAGRRAGSPAAVSSGLRASEVASLSSVRDL